MRDVHSGGTARGGRRRVTLLDIAADTGLSRATVSLVLRDSGRIPEETRRRVRESIERLGYVYHQGAASLRLRSSGAVGVVVTDLSNPFFAELTLGIEEVMEHHGQAVFLANTFDDLRRQQESVQALVERRADGLLLVPALGTDARLPDWLARADVPTVLLTRQVPQARAPYLGLDEHAGGVQAARHLLGHGRARLGYFGGPEAAGPRQERLRGVTEVLGGAGLALDEHWTVPCEPTSLAGFELAAQLLREAPVPDGLMCHNDALAFGVLRAFHEVGVRVPEATAVLGFDDVAHARVSVPSLSSVSAHPRELGRQAGRRLVALMADDAARTTGTPGTEPERTLVQPLLSPRESCGCGHPQS